ncbi:thioredoxin family protein [Streptomyces sp. NPDC058955]|uniref:thioredoxin family protein n=1 Tax=unclassified Streptomyces TaxID=2593676 RepID=UPI00364D47C9
MDTQARQDGLGGQVVSGVTEITDLETFYGLAQRDRLYICFADADWCGPCRVLRARYSRLASDYAGHELFHRFDVDVVPEVAQALHVQMLPTTFVYRNGEPLDWPWPGAPGPATQEEYRAWIDRHL